MPHHALSPSRDRRRHRSRSPNARGLGAKSAPSRPKLVLDMSAHGCRVEIHDTSILTDPNVVNLFRQYVPPPPPPRPAIQFLQQQAASCPALNDATPTLSDREDTKYDVAIPVHWKFTTGQVPWKFETMLNQVNLAKLSYCFIRVYPLQLDMIELKTRKHLELWSTAVTYCIDSPAIDAALVNHAKWLDVSEILQELKGLMLQEIRIKAFHEFPRPSLPQPRWEWAMFDEFLRLHHIESTLVHRATAQVFMDILKYIPNWTTMFTECELIHDTQCGNIGLAFFFPFGFPSPMIDGHSCQPIPFRCFYPFGHGTSMEAAIPIIQNQVILPSCNIDEQNEQWYPSPGFFCRIIDTKVTEQNWKNLRRQVLLKTARQSNNKEVQVIGIAGLRQNCHYTLHGGGVLAETACAHWFDTVHQTREKRWLARTHLSKVLGISYIDKEKAGFK